MWATAKWEIKYTCCPAGKLGHGDTNRVYKPKVVEALQGMFIRKVCAGSQSSLALTSTGQVGMYSYVLQKQVYTNEIRIFCSRKWKSHCSRWILHNSSFRFSLLCHPQRFCLYEKNKNMLFSCSSRGLLIMLIHAACLQVYAWGCGACLGCGSSEATALRPKLIEELATTRVVDISIGDSHCLALSHGMLLFFPSIFHLVLYNCQNLISS